MLEVLERQAGPLPVGAWLVVGTLVVVGAAMYRGRGVPANYYQQDTSIDPPFTFVSAMPPNGPGIGLGSFWSPRRPRKTDMTDVGNRTYLPPDVLDPGDLLMRVSQRQGRAAALVPMALQLQPGPIGWTPGR